MSAKDYLTRALGLADQNRRDMIPVHYANDMAKAQALALVHIGEQLTRIANSLDRGPDGEVRSFCGHGRAVTDELGCTSGSRWAHVTDGTPCQSGPVTP